jgi:glycine/D-amino acid oxidase-like deaminating enzyme
LVDLIDFGAYLTIVAIIGAGITGISAAFYLAQAARQRGSI